MGEAPAEQLRVAQGDEEARGAEVRRGADERPEIVVGLRHRVGEVVDAGRVAGDAAESLDHTGVARLDRLANLAVADVTMHPEAEGVAGGLVLGRRRADVIPGHRQAERRAVHRAERLTDVEAELRVQAERPVVVGDLHQAHAGGALLRRPVQHRGHQRASHVVVLRRWVHAHRPDRGDGRALVQEAAAQDAAVPLRHNAVDVRVVDEPPDRPGRRLDGREVVRESVAIRDRRERLVADAAGLDPVAVHRLSNRDVHFVLSDDCAVGPL